jgi:hypothetical protein
MRSSTPSLLIAIGVCCRVVAAIVPPQSVSPCSDHVLTEQRPEVDEEEGLRKYISMSEMVSVMFW